MEQARSARILVIEDEEDIAGLVRYHLAKHGYGVDAASTGEEGLAKVWSDTYNAVILDLMLPGADGFTVCKRLRDHPATQLLPIIMLTARGGEADIVRGLETGADDYITKPFSPSILVARVRSVLRRRTRTEEPGNAVVSAHGLMIDPLKLSVENRGAAIELTNTEFRVLAFLAKHQGRVFTRSQIVEGVRGTDYPVTDRSVDVQIVGLRRKLGEAGELIETIRGVGYRFRE